MVKNYIKTAWRFLLKNKMFSLINIIGLATGTLCCLYILLYVKDQYSYDKHHKQADRIYRVTVAVKMEGQQHLGAAASPPVAPALKNDFDEVQDYARVVTISMLGVKQQVLAYKDKTFYEKDAVFADPGFFNIFTYHFTNGSPANALKDPYTVVLLKSVASKLFGSENPLDKVISIDNAYGKHDFKVTGVVDESLGKSHLQANMFIAMNSGGIGQYVMQNNTWAGNNFVNTYIKLKPNADATALEKKLPAFLNKYGQDEFKNFGMQKALHLQPIGDIHTTPKYEAEISTTTDPSLLYILILIAVLIQVIACINFMNLSTARASKRAKEVGLRKVIGAGQSDLVKQFLGESIMLATLGVVIALPLLALVLPTLNQVTGTSIDFTFFNDYHFWLTITGLILFTGVIAGSYPAFYLSAFKIIKVIKGNFTNNVSAVGIRRSLVVFQFVLSIVMITGIVIIYSQLNYIKNKDLGFDKAQKLIFNFYTNDAIKKMDALENDLKQVSDVKSISKATNYPSQFVMEDHGVYLRGNNMVNAVDAQNMTTDKDFVKTFGIKMASGRDFTLNDSGKVLINQALAKKLGLTEQTAPGTRLYSKYGSAPESYVEVAGVMKDFNYNSLHGEVKPFMLIYDPNRGDLSHLIVSTSSANYKSLLNQIQIIWQKDMPGVPFEYSFLDNEVEQQYKSEISLSQIINLFTLMAVLISCLGLFGLAAFSAEQRTKEIGVRKVLGANTFGIVQLLSKDFLKLVLIAIVIATPIAYWAMDKWLQAFAYRIPLSWWMFALSGIMAVMIAIATVSFQSIKAALTNPVKSLRTE